jgi:aspartate/methionine/tyrosine aminotransferase
MGEFAERLKGVLPSGTLRTIQRARELRRAGADIITFGNRPATPQAARDATMRAAGEAWSSSYTESAGLPELRAAIARAMAEDGVRIDPDRQLIVTIGAKQALFVTMLALLDPGDEVIIPSPAWVSHDPAVRLAGGVPVTVPLREERAFHLDPAEIEAVITPRTKMLLLTNPHNPTGVVMDADTLAALAAIARRHQLTVVADECYKHYVYDGRRHLSIAALPDMAERTLTVSTASKIFNMFGWRVGWVTGPEDVIAQVLVVHEHAVGSATSFAQAGALAALQLDRSAIQTTVDQYRRARDVMVEGLNRIPGISTLRPEGGYLMFPNVSKLGDDAEVSAFFLETAGVQTVPGSAFGPFGEGHVRINFTCTPEEAGDAVERIRSAVARR